MAPGISTLTYLLLLTVRLNLIVSAEAFILGTASTPFILLILKLPFRPRSVPLSLRLSFFVNFYVGKRVNKVI